MSDVIDVTSSLSDVRTEIRAHNGELVVKRTQDVEGYLEQNRREFNAAPDTRVSRNRSNLRKVASIPMIVAEQWIREGINIFDPSPEVQKRITAKLNSNEYRYLRTAPGRIKTYRT